MDDEVQFIGLAFDDARVGPSLDDFRRFIVALKERGFTVPEGQLPGEQPAAAGGVEVDILEVRGQSIEATVSVGKHWMVQIATAVQDIDVVRDPELGRRGIDQLIDLIGVMTELADTYLGFVSNEADDDLSFVVEDPPVEITEPLALVYLGRRYLADWGSAPDFAADAELDVTLPAGRLIVPSLADLA